MYLDKPMVSEKPISSLMFIYYFCYKVHDGPLIVSKDVFKTLSLALSQCV